VQEMDARNPVSKLMSNRDSMAEIDRHSHPEINEWGRREWECNTLKHVRNARERD